MELNEFIEQIYKPEQKAQRLQMQKLSGQVETVRLLIVGNGKQGLVGKIEKNTMRWKWAIAIILVVLTPALSALAYMIFRR